MNDEQLIDNISGEPVHECKQEDRLQRIEADQKRLNKRQEETIKNIEKKLTQIWKAINKGDRDNLKTIITVTISFIGAVVTVFVAFIAFLKFA